MQQDQAPVLLDSSNCASFIKMKNMKINCSLILFFHVCLVSLYHAVKLHENGFFAYLIYFKSDTRREEGLRGGWHSRLDISGDSCTNHQHHRCTSRMSGG